MVHWLTVRKSIYLLHQLIGNAIGTIFWVIPFGLATRNPATTISNVTPRAATSIDSLHGGKARMMSIVRQGTRRSLAFL